MWQAFIIVMLGVAIIVALVFVGLAYLDGQSLKNEVSVEKKRKKIYPRCTCQDVNSCDTYCIAKKNFTKVHGFK